MQDHDVIYSDHRTEAPDEARDSGLVCVLDLDSFLPFRLNRAATEMSRMLATLYEGRFDIDIPSWRVIATLGHAKNITAQDIVASTRTHKSTISRAVSSLIERGWVERGVSDLDRRAQVLRFTTEGQAVYDQLVPIMLSFEDELKRTLGLRACNNLDRGLKSLEGMLGLIGDDAPQN